MDMSMKNHLVPAAFPLLAILSTSWSKSITVPYPFALGKVPGKAWSGTEGNARKFYNLEFYQDDL